MIPCYRESHFTVPSPTVETGCVKQHVPHTPDRGRAKSLVKSPQRSDTEDNQELILLALVPSCSCVPKLVMNIHGRDRWVTATSPLLPLNFPLWGQLLDEFFFPTTDKDSLITTGCLSSRARGWLAHFTINYLHILLFEGICMKKYDRTSHMNSWHGDAYNCSAILNYLIRMTLDFSKKITTYPI